MGERPGKPGQSRSDQPRTIGLPPLGCGALVQLCCSLGLSPFICRMGRAQASLPVQSSCREEVETGP